jgi:hypothetical protein
MFEMIDNIDEYDSQITGKEEVQEIKELSFDNIEDDEW